MYRLLLSVALAVALQGVNATAGELPTFELLGFPVSRHQVAVLGSANVKEQGPSFLLLFGEGMPASSPSGGFDAAPDGSRRADGRWRAADHCTGRVLAGCCARESALGRVCALAAPFEDIRGGEKCLRQDVRCCCLV